MVQIEGHGNVAGNRFEGNAQTTIHNNVTVSSVDANSPPPGSISIDSDKEVGPHRGWYLAAAIVTVISGVISSIQGFRTGDVAVFDFGNSDSDFFSVNSGHWLVFAAGASLIAASLAFVLFIIAGDNDVKPSTARLRKQVHFGGSDSNRLRLVTTSSKCPRCKKPRKLRFFRAKPDPASGGASGADEQGQLFLRCVKNSSHKWPVRDDIISELLDTQ